LSKIAKEFNAEYFCCDFSNLDEVEKIAIEISESIQIDILINSAGIFDVASIEETSIVDIKETFNINFFAPFIFIKQFINSMETRNWGRIK